MKRFQSSFLLPVLAAALLLSGCFQEVKKDTPKLSITVPEIVPKAQTFVVPEGAAYITMPENPDHDDFLAFDREFTAALAARKSVICTCGHMPLDWPDLCVMDYGVFWVKSFSYRLEWAIPEGGTDAKMFYTYQFDYFDLSEQDIQRMKREIDSEVARIFALFPTDADPWTQARIVHDELVKTVSYDHEKDSEYFYNPYGPLVRHEAICQGYAAAFSFLMSRAGNYTTFSASEDHGWNAMVMPRTREEYVDCTWDDLDLFDAEGRPYVLHDFFFLTREEVESVDSHTISTGDPYNTYDGEIVHANYFYHEGYMLDSFDLAALTEVYRRQFQAGNNLLEARFETEEEYQKALALLENDCAGLSEVLSWIGYYDGYYYFHNDDIHTLSVGLYPPKT